MESNLQIRIFVWKVQSRKLDGSYKNYEMVKNNTIVRFRSENFMIAVRWLRDIAKMLDDIHNDSQEKMNIGWEKTMTRKYWPYVKVKFSASPCIGDESRMIHNLWSKSYIFYMILNIIYDMGDTYIFDISWFIFKWTIKLTTSQSEIRYSFELLDSQLSSSNLQTASQLILEFARQFIENCVLVKQQNLLWIHSW